MTWDEQENVRVVPEGFVKEESIRDPSLDKIETSKQRHERMKKVVEAYFSSKGSKEKQRVY